MGLFSTLFQNKHPKCSLSSLNTDIHSHLLPGIDDGAKSIDHTIGMLRKMEDLGFKKLIFTPHVMSGVYDNTSEIILNKLAKVQQVITELEINLEVDASAEYFFDETLFKRIATRDLLPFHKNHILFEFSFHTKPDRFEELIFQLNTAGYQPVLAHFERYLYFHNKPEVLRQLKDLGCMIQANWLSFTGHYGPEVKKQAQFLAKQNAIDVLGTDCHRIQHLEILENFLKSKEASHLLNRKYLNNLV